MRLFAQQVRSVAIESIFERLGILDDAIVLDVFLIPLTGLFEVHLDSQSEFVQGGETAHGLRVPLDGCLLEPVGFHVVVRVVSKVELGLDVSAFGFAYSEGVV